MAAAPHSTGVYSSPSRPTAYITPPAARAAPISTLPPVRAPLDPESPGGRTINYGRFFSPIDPSVSPKNNKMLGIALVIVGVALFVLASTLFLIGSNMLLFLAICNPLTATVLSGIAAATGVASGVSIGVGSVHISNSNHSKPQELLVAE